MFQVLLEVLQTHLIAIFILPIVLRVLLHSVISQMDEFVIEFFDIKLLAARADVCILIEKSFQMTVDACHEAIASKVKLPIADQQWMINILLHNESLVLCFSSLLGSISTRSTLRNKLLDLGDT